MVNRRLSGTAIVAGDRYRKVLVLQGIGTSGHSDRRFGEPNCDQIRGICRIRNCPGLTVCPTPPRHTGCRSSLDITRSKTVTSFGRVISVRGSLARVGLLAASRLPTSEIRATVGRFISIRCASSVIVAMITEVSCEHLPTSDEYIASASVDLLGEILGGDRPKFQRGVTDYPTIGDSVDLIANQELRTIYAPSGSDQIDVGTLQQDRSVTAYVDVDEMLSKHFAVLGSTGVGKSSGVSLLLNEILEIAAEPAHLPARRAQRIRPLLRRPRAGAQPAQPEAAVLAVQFRGDRRRASSAAAPASPRSSRSSPRSSRSPRASTPSTRTPTALGLKRVDPKTSRATPSTRRCPIASST